MKCFFVAVVAFCLSLAAPTWAQPVPPLGTVLNGGGNGFVLCLPAQDYLHYLQRTKREDMRVDLQINQTETELMITADQDWTSWHLLVVGTVDDARVACDLASGSGGGER